MGLAQGAILTTRHTKSTATGLAVIALGAGLSAPAPAQPVLERNVAPAQRAPETPPLAPPPAAEPQDDTPLGADLTAVVLLGPEDAPGAAAGSQGVQVARIADLPRRKSLERALSEYLGRPLSRKLIGEIQTTVVKHYRAAGLPFVSVTPPPQDVTDGVLRLRVIEFRLGRKTVSGAKLSTPAHVAAQVRAEPGDRLRGPQLEQDLTWLNHSPFRQATTIFSPGSSVGFTDMRLDVADTKRWQVFGGYSNSGSRATGLDRYFLGAQVGDLLLRDSLLSYELTASDDYLAGRNGRYAEAGAPHYASHSLVFGAPLAPRQDVTIVANYVQTYSPVQAFDSRVRTEEISATYRTALSNFLRPLPGDLSLGVEARGQQKDTFFGAVQVVHSVIDVGQVAVGWSNSWTGLVSHQSFSATVHVSPGNLGARNRDLDFSNFTGGAPAPNYVAGRVSKAGYAYGDVDYALDLRLGGGMRYVTAIHAQIASEALLDTEQIALGGEGGVRAFNLDDGAFDEGVIWRNELRLRSRNLFGRLNQRLADTVSSYVFADAALARDLNYLCTQGYCRPRQGYAGAGAGLDYQVGRHFSLGATGAWAFNRVEPVSAPFAPPTTRAGHLRLLARATLRF